MNITIEDLANLIKTHGPMSALMVQEKLGYTISLTKITHLLYSGYFSRPKESLLKPAKRQFGNLNAIPPAEVVYELR